MKTTQTNQETTSLLIVGRNRTQNVYTINSEENFLSLFTHLGYNVKFFESLRLERQYTRSWRAEQRTPIGWKFTNVRSYSQRDGWTSISKNKTYTHSQLKKKFETLYGLHLRNLKNQAATDARNNLMAGGISFMNNHLVKLMPTKIEINKRLKSLEILNPEYRKAADKLNIARTKYDNTKSKWDSPTYQKLQAAYNRAGTLVDDLKTEMKKEVCLQLRNEIEDINGTRNAFYAKNFNFSVSPKTWGEENYATNSDGSLALIKAGFEIKADIFKWEQNPESSFLGRLSDYNTYGLEGELAYVIRIKGDATKTNDGSWEMNNFNIIVKAEEPTRYKSGTSFDFNMSDLINASQEKYLEMLTSIQNQRDGRVNITLELTNMLIDITSKDNTIIRCGDSQHSSWSMWNQTPPSEDECKHAMNPETCIDCLEEGLKRN